MIVITPSIALSDNEIKFRFVRASGPGGQNVNKVSSAVELHFDLLRSPSLTDDLKQRLIKLAGKRVSAEGILLIDAQRFRTQILNRKDALARLGALIQAAAIPPKTRTPTRPSRSQREKRLAVKRQSSVIKKTRRRKTDWTD